MPVPCCHYTRRQVLKLAAIAASTSLLPVIDPERAWARSRRRDQAPAVPHNLELVTLTEDRVIFTWYTGTPGFTGDRLQPAPADTELLLGSSPGDLKTVYHRNDHTPFHHAEVGGLEPGRTYFYEARSGGVRAIPSLLGSGSPIGTVALSTSNLANPATPLMFTVPHPPPGRYLFSVALANDVHMGETVAGLATTLPVVGGVPPAVVQRAGAPPYPVVMCEAMVAEARARGADVLIVAGDVSSEAKPDDLKSAKRLLGGFGHYGKDWFVARGNHDRPHSDPEDHACHATARGHDCFDDRFYERGRTWFSKDVFGMRLVCLDTYDRAGNGGDNGTLAAQQYDWFATELTKHKDQPTLVFGHHPLTLESSLINVAPLYFDMDPVQAQQIQQLYAQTPGVFFHHSGHTHRNKRTTSVTADAVTFQEVAATKEYPGGFTLLRIFTGGFAVNFFKSRSDLAREWSERTRAESFNLGPLYQLGTFGDRNYTVNRDLSGLHQAHH